MTEWIVTSSVLILVVIGLRFLLKGKISLRLQYGLWALVLVRLLVPLSISSPISVMNLFPEPSLSAQEVWHIDYSPPEVPLADPFLGATQQQVPSQQTQAALEQTIENSNEEAGTPVTLEAVLFWVWIAGMGVMGLVLAGTNLHFSSRLRRSRRAVALQDCPLPVYVSGCVATPCLYGLFLPKIYLTPDFEGQRLDHVLTHELTHWRQADHIWSVLRCLCLVLHWYNPLVWIAASLSKQDAELACDEAVLKRLGDTQRTAYGKTLIEMSCLKQNTSGLFIAATTMLTTKRSLKERIAMIARKPKTAVITLIAVFLISLVVVGCTFTGASDEPPVMTAVHFEETTAIYVYEKPGFGSDFFIKINQNGTFTYREGALSSYFGLGTWTQKDDILALTDKPSANPGIAFYNEFRVEEDALVWLAKNSTGFMHRNIPMEDGARFLYRGSEESPVPVWTYVGTTATFIEDYLDGGLRATFVNVDGTVFVWNHFAVDTLDGLAVTEIGTVTTNDASKLPDTHLAACRIPVGTTLYFGKDAEDSRYPAVYFKLKDTAYYARLLPETAFRGDDRWWETMTINDGASELTMEILSQLAKEKGALISHTDLQEYSHAEVRDSNYLIYRLYDVDTDYRLVLACANTQTPIEAISTRLYRKDTPGNYIDIRTDDLEAFLKDGTRRLSEDLMVTNKIDDVRDWIINFLE